MRANKLRGLFRIGILLPAGFAAVVTTVAILAAGGWQHAREQGVVLSEIANHDSAVRKATTQVSGSVEAINMRLMGVLAEVYSPTGSVATVEKQFAELLSGWKDVERLLNVEREREAFAVLAKGYSALVANRPKIADALKAAKKPQLSAAYDDWIEAVVPFRRALQAKVASLDTQAASKIEEMTAAADRQVSLTFMLGGLAGFIALLAGTYVLLGVVKPLRQLVTGLHELGQGNFQVVLAGLARTDEIGEIAKAVGRFRDKLEEKSRIEAAEAEERVRGDAEKRQAAARQESERQAQLARRDAAAARQTAVVVDSLRSVLAELAIGGLDDLDADFSGDYQQIKDDYNAAVGQLRQTVAAIASATMEIAKAAASIGASASDLSQRTEEQAASLEQTSSAMKQVADAVRQNSESAYQADSLTRATRDVAEKGSAVVAQAVVAMSRIEESSRSIGDIIAVIDEIARQTNLLALNAAVEAARAGDAGRGFAVVASEVRMLAQRSAQAAKDVKTLITGSVGHVQEGVDLVNKSGESLGEIGEFVSRVANIAEAMASSSKEQAGCLGEIETALSRIDEMTQQNAVLVEENAATVALLEQQASTMDQRVRFFKLDDGDSADGPRTNIAA
jgi:methyl-accepting chemotaxis protein